MTLPLITYLSLGWGVQSFTLVAMVATKELSPIDMAIHADTTHESANTYRFAEKWTPRLAERGVKVVTVRPLQAALLKPTTNKPGSYSSELPFFTQRISDGKEGQIRRECTENWKIRPIRRYLRSKLPKSPPAGAVDCWQGISLDEWTRMKDADVQDITNVYPLVERPITRADCVAWLEQKGLEVPPKSSCTFCPYHSPATWRRIKQQGGPDWEEAVQADRDIRDLRMHEGYRVFIHPAMKPLPEAVAIPEDFGLTQLEFDIDRPCDGGDCHV